jgi:hypothetical protein
MQNVNDNLVRTTDKSTGLSSAVIANPLSLLKTTTNNHPKHNGEMQALSPVIQAKDTGLHGRHTQ